MLNKPCFTKESNCNGLEQTLDSSTGWESIQQDGNQWFNELKHNNVFITTFHQGQRE